MNEEQIKQYYERIEKLLNGANKETYKFVPEEIKQILKCYEYLQQRIDKAINFIEKYVIATETEDILLTILKGDK